MGMPYKVKDKYISNIMISFPTSYAFLLLAFQQTGMPYTVKDECNNMSSIITSFHTFVPMYWPKSMTRAVGRAEDHFGSGTMSLHFGKYVGTVTLKKKQLCKKLS
jgi:hypothetical protein